MTSVWGLETCFHWLCGKGFPSLPGLSIPLYLQGMVVLFAYSSRLFSDMTSWWLLLNSHESFENSTTAVLQIEYDSLSTTVLRIWNCYHPGSKLSRWASFLFLREESSLLCLQSWPFSCRLLFPPNVTVTDDMNQTDYVGVLWSP